MALDGESPRVAPAAGAAGTAEPIWFASYPPGMPHSIDPDAYPSLPAMLCDACAPPLEGLPLSGGPATAILTLNELHWTIRDICDDITAEIGRPRPWTEAGIDAPDIP